MTSTTKTGTAMARRLRALVIPLLLLGALEIFARTVARHSDALAPPSAAARALAGALADGSLWQASGFTIGVAALGLLLGSLVGIPLGLVIGLSRTAAAASFLSIEVLRPLPSVALIPLAMLTFGFGVALEASVVAFATFWLMLILTQAAVRQIEPGLLEVSRALQLTAYERAVKIILPAVLRRLFLALRLGVAVALVVAVTAEIVANPHGMGYALMMAQQSLDPALMLAWLFWIGVVGYAISEGAVRLDRMMARRMGEVNA